MNTRFGAAAGPFLIWIVAMVLILGSLAMINMGLDELANPRVRRSE